MPRSTCSPRWSVRFASTRSRSPRRWCTRHARRAGAEALADLRAIGVEVEPVEIDAVQLAELRVSTGCKLPDCCVLALAQLLGVGVLTFDERLGRAAAALTG